MTTTGVVFPLMTVRCWSVTRFSFFIQSGSLKFKICTLPPPSSVTLLPPSMTVLVLMGRFMVLVTGIVTGAAPQLNVMMPPFFTAALSASKVQVPAVPVPITAVGFDTSAGCAPAGSEAVQWVGIVDPLAPPVPPALPPTPVLAPPVLDTMPPVPDGVPPVPATAPPLPVMAPPVPTLPPSPAWLASAAPVLVDEEHALIANRQAPASQKPLENRPWVKSTEP